MKNIRPEMVVGVLILAALALGAGLLAVPHEPKEGERADAVATLATGSSDATIYLRLDGVYCNDELMKGASAATMRVVGYVIAADAFRVYVCDGGFERSGGAYYVVAGADPTSVKLLSGGYLRDAWHVYYYDPKSTMRAISGADAPSFRVTGDGNYGVDARAVYLAGVPVPEADPASFESLGGTYGAAGAHVYGRDAARAYADAKAIPGADAKTFMPLPESDFVLARDARALYQGAEKIADIQNADMRTFRIEKTGAEGEAYVARDDARIYATAAAAVLPQE